MKPRPSVAESGAYLVRKPSKSTAKLLRISDTWVGLLSVFVKPTLKMLAYSLQVFFCSLLAISLKEKRVCGESCNVSSETHEQLPASGLTVKITGMLPSSPVNPVRQEAQSEQLRTLCEQLAASTRDESLAYRLEHISTILQIRPSQACSGS